MLVIQGVYAVIQALVYQIPEVEKKKEKINKEIRKKKSYMAGSSQKKVAG